jgi:hypothetical protein
MKRKLSISAILANLLLAFIFGVALGFAGIPPLLTAAVVFGVGTGLQFIKPFNMPKGALFEGLQKEIWEPSLKENPVPDTSFVYASTDKSEYVDNNKIHLQEAGIEPGVHENYFDNNEDELPLANVDDIPHEALLATYSTEQTRHRNLQEIELAYNRMQSVIGRHKTSLAKNLGKRAAHAWTPSANTTYNKLISLAADDSILDAIIDLQANYMALDKGGEALNICITPEHLARIQKEDKKLYKEIMGDKDALIYGFKPYYYSQTPLFTAAGAKKAFGAVAEAGDKRSTFTWATDEVFRCFGDVEMYYTLKSSGLQADTISFAQRALVGNIRATTPKYLGGII